VRTIKQLQRTHWLCQRSRICLPVRPGIWPASKDHDLVPCRCTWSCRPTNMWIKRAGYQRCLNSAVVPGIGVCKAKRHTETTIIWSSSRVHGLDEVLLSLQPSCSSPLLPPPLTVTCRRNAGWSCEECNRCQRGACTYTRALGTSISEMELFAFVTISAMLPLDLTFEVQTTCCARSNARDTGRGLRLINLCKQFDKRSRRKAA
jgi:hypothetical protein